MDINYTDGKIVNTDEMPDWKAHLYETVQTMMEVFKQYDVSFYLSYMVPQGENAFFSGAERIKSPQELDYLLRYLQKTLLDQFDLKIAPKTEDDLNPDDEGEEWKKNPEENQ